MAAVSMWNNRNSVTVEQSEQSHRGTVAEVSLWNSRSRVTMEQS